MKIRALLCLLLFWGLATGGGARAATADVTQDLVTAAFFAMNGTQLIRMSGSSDARHAVALDACEAFG